MRRAVVVLGLLFAGPVYGDDAAQIVDQAMRAHGGESALAKTKYVHRTAKGGWFVFGKENSFSAETYLRFPDGLRDTVDADVNGQKTRITIVLNGDRGWQRLGGGFQDLDKERLTELRDELHVLWLVIALPLKERSLTLAAPVEATVLGKPAHAIKVIGTNRPEATLFFDKQSGLLVKVERPAKQAGLSLKKEYLLADHKDFDGVKLPTRWLELTNGNKASDLTVTGYDFPARIDEKLLQKP